MGLLPNTEVEFELDDKGARLRRANEPTSPGSRSSRRETCTALRAPAPRPTVLPFARSQPESQPNRWHHHGGRCSAW